MVIYLAITKALEWWVLRVRFRFRQAPNHSCEPQTALCAACSLARPRSDVDDLIPWINSFPSRMFVLTSQEYIHPTAAVRGKQQQFGFDNNPLKSPIRITSVISLYRAPAVTRRPYCSPIALPDTGRASGHFSRESLMADPRATHLRSTERRRNRSDRV